MSRNITEQELRDIHRRMGLPEPSLSSEPAGDPKRQKFGNRQKELDGHIFASTKEAEHYLHLKFLERNGDISGLKLQPRFVLREAMKTVSGKKLRAIEYVADFEFIRGGLVRVVQDVKSKPTMTQVYRVKAKLFQQRYPDVIFEEIL